MSFLSDTQKSLVNRLHAVVDDIEARMMLGTVGLYAGDAQIGILDGESIYLRANEDSRAVFEDKGAVPYDSSAGVAQVAYFKVPGAILDDDELFAAWVHHALDAAD
jgi:TfoX/Sxy family transcriptional regulator of competence genes